MNIAFALWCLVVKISKDSWSRDSTDVLLTSLEGCIMSIYCLYSTAEFIPVGRNDTEMRTLNSGFLAGLVGYSVVTMM